MRLAWEFLKRDALIAVSYRVAFAVQLMGNMFVLVVFYYIGKTIGDQAIPSLDRYGGSYLAFLLIGIALTDCVTVSLTTFATQIREGQMTGTLEAMLMSPVRLPVILIYSSLWAYCYSAVRFVLYLGLGMIFYNVSMAKANLLSALVVFFLTVLSFAGVGMLWAGIVMLVKRGEAIMAAGGYLVVLLGGVLFPVTVLPAWIQGLAALMPLTYALEGMRLALLKGYSLGDLAGTVFILGIFAVILLSLGMMTFSITVRSAKKWGSLIQY